MRTTVYSHGNRLFRQCSGDSIQEATQPDQIVNLTCRELRNMTLYVLADRLATVASGWWDKPWAVRDVMAWESALAAALEIDGLPERFKKSLRHILGIVSGWLTEFDAYEQACIEDERETMLNLGVAR